MDKNILYKVNTNQLSDPHFSYYRYWNSEKKKISSIPIHKAFFPHKIKLVLPCLALYPSLLALSGRVERGHLCTLVSWRYCQHLHQSYHYYLGSDVELEPVGPKLLYYIGNQSRDHKIVIGAVEGFFYFVSTQKINSIRNVLHKNTFLLNWQFEFLTNYLRRQIERFSLVRN